jgi:hypothetical protein
VVATALGRRAEDLQVLERRTVALLFDDARYAVVTVRDHATGEPLRWRSTSTRASRWTYASCARRIARRSTSALRRFRRGCATS